MSATTTSSVNVYLVDEDDEGCARLYIGTDIPYRAEDGSENTEPIARLARTLEASEELLAELEAIAEGWLAISRREVFSRSLTPWEQERLAFTQAAIAKARGQS